MKRKYIASILISVCVAVVGLWYLSFFKEDKINLNSSEMTTVEYNNDNTELAPKSNTSKVCVSGEVANAGVYEIKEGDRIEDVIKMAGGATENADLYALNLAKYVKDEDNIIIPKKSVDKNDIVAQNSTDKAIDNENNDGKNYPININVADKAELMSLSGIGDKIADEIIAYRKENNGFKTIDEIKKVNRIGDSVFNKIKDKITV